MGCVNGVLRVLIKKNLDAYEKRQAQEEADNRAREAEERESLRIVQARKELRVTVGRLLDAACFEEADRLYASECTDWWERADFEEKKAQARLFQEEEKKLALFIQRFFATYETSSLADLDALYRARTDLAVELTADEWVALKLPKLRRQLTAIGIQLDVEQQRANARPESRLLIRARAGSGKTRTLCARAALAIRDEGLTPNQVMILAFNKSAAAEVRHRVQKLGGIADFVNARTFHSLAYQLVKPRRKLLFDAGGHPSEREQSRFIQRMMQRIMNPAFKEAMTEFFRKELEQIEDIGRDLSREEYLQFRRALELVTLGGDRVKSNGEKFIADVLFELGIEYRYERAWAWKIDFLEGATYKPDFSLIANGRDYILEHWAIDPNDRSDSLPQHWDISTEEYRRQIEAKRRFWRDKGIPLIETHTGLMREGRMAFESRLQRILERAGIRCRKLTKEDIINRVFNNDFAISRMAELFMQFIQRAKKRGWSPDAMSIRLTEAPDKEPRSRLFHQLALRAYREYEL